jgi:hypothetical protein
MHNLEFLHKQVVPASRRRFAAALASIGLSACHGPPAGGGAPDAGAPSAEPSASAPAADTTPSGVSLRDVYVRTAPYTTATMGHFATGLALADINGDHLPDMIVSNGNDMSPQPLVVFTNDPRNGNRFASWPTWLADVNEYHGGLAVGDVDKDGWLDVAVAVASGRDRDISGGGVRIYRNLGGKLEQAPSYRTSDHYMTAGCALGDIDADGDLDLAVAVMLEGTGTIPPTAGTPPPTPGRARIYLNEGASIATKPAWRSEVEMIAGDVTFADVNQDGWMDLVVAGERAQVFYGHAPKPGEKVPLDVRPSWESKDTFPFSYSVDVGRFGQDPALSLVVSDSCLFSDCDSRFVMFTPASGNESVWRSAPVQYASKVYLADLTGDGNLDLMAGQWGPNKQGGPLWGFDGSAKSPPFAASPDFVTETSSVLEGLASADVKRRCLRTRRHELSSTSKRAVITLPDRRIAAYRKVLRNGAELRPAQYTWTPAGNWISLRKPLDAGDRIEVEYEYSPVQDMAVANFQNYSPSIGNYVFFSFLAPPTCPP